MRNLRSLCPISPTAARVRESVRGLGASFCSLCRRVAPALSFLPPRYLCTLAREVMASSLLMSKTSNTAIFCEDHPGATLTTSKPLPVWRPLIPISNTCTKNRACPYHNSICNKQTIRNTINPYTIVGNHNGFCTCPRGAISDLRLFQNASRKEKYAKRN